MSVLYPYQKELVNRDNKFEIDVKSRQIGYSFGFAYKCIKRALLKGNNQLIVSASQRQSNIVMGYIEKFWRNIKKLPSSKNIEMIIDSRTEKQFKLDKEKYVSINCLPARSETIQGFPGDIFLDEFSLYKNDKEVLEGILPSITRGYNLTISSKPLGCNNLFYHIYHNTNNKAPDYKRYSITIYEAIRKGLLGKNKQPIDVEIIRRNTDEDSFRQEYLCEFQDDASSYFTYDLLRSCLEDYNPEQLQGRTLIGIDIGRSHDRTAIAVIKENEKRCKLKRLEILHKQPFQEQRATIEQIFIEETPETVLIDKGGIGLQLAEELEEAYTFVTGVIMNNMVKNDCVTTTKKYMEQNNFKFSDNVCDTRKLITEFHKISKKVTANNQLNFDSIRDEQGHADSPWSICLALVAAKQENEIKMAFIS